MLNERGQEVPDPRPVAIPLGYETPESLQSMIARMVDVHSRLASKQGLESFEEADDFNIDGEDDSGLLSGYQLSQMQEERPSEDPERKRDEEPRRSDDRSEVETKSGSSTDERARRSNNSDRRKSGDRRSANSVEGTQDES